MNIKHHISKFRHAKLMAIVGMAFCMLAGCSEKQMQQADAIDHSDSAAQNKQETELTPEPADPDIYDMSVWENIESGIYSGFGSIDVAYSKSIPPEGNITESIELQGWKGERVSCKLLVFSAGSEENISIKASGFSNDNYKIDKERTSISVIKYVLSDEFSKGCGPRDKDKIPAHISPDLLSNANSFTIDTPGTRPVWISVDIPPDTPAGIYKGSISRQSASVTLNHIITLEVLNKLLPDPSDWSFHLDLWQNPYAVARYHGVKLWSQEHLDLLRPLLKKLANAGQKCITTTLIDKPWDGGPCFDAFGSMINWIRKKDGTWEYDYTVFDQYVSLAMECGIKKQINCYSMVPITNEFSWFDEETSETVVMEAIPGTEEYENFWRGFLLDFRTHLKEKGWFEITTLALDEREEEEMTNMFSFLKQTAPKFKISMAGFYYKDINSSIYNFSSNWRDSGRIPGEAIKSRKKSGLITTYYVACGIPKPNNFTFSPPSESCYEGWLAAAMGFDGFLRWAYNSWPENPVIDSRYTMWPSGDTYLVYPGARSSIRFERLREGIQDYEKIRILREELAENTSMEAAAAKERLNNFLNSIDTKTLDNLSAADVINEGKQLVYEIVKSVFNDQPDCAAQLLKKPGLQLLGNRFFTFNTVVRVNQIETSRDVAHGEDESSIHSPREARAFREAVEKGWPGARITWAFSWLALKDKRPNYRDLKKLVVSYHKKYGDEITFIPGGYFANMYNTREQVNRDLHDGLQMVSDMVGGGYRPKSVIAGFLSAENLRFLAEEEGIHVCQGNIWSQYAIDNGDGEGSISYPYYPSREHFCKPAQGKEDLIDCVNLDGWTIDFLNATYPGGRTINGEYCGSRQGVGPIETVIRLGTERGTKEMLSTTAAHFDKGFELNDFAWVTCIWELCLVEGRKIYGYKGRNGLDGLVIWLSEMRRRWPEAKCITQGEFGMLWREQFKNNDNLNYRFVQRGSGICGSDPDMEIRWFMNKDFRLALLRDWKANSPEKLIDFTRYDIRAAEPADPKPGQHTRNWSLLNRLNQKGIRPQDKPIPIEQLNAEEQAMIKQRYPELINEVKQPINYEPFIWRSTPPDDCPFEKSTDIVGIRFTGKCNDLHIDGAPFADTWYFSWASDDKLYSPFTDGAVPRLDGGRDHSRSWKIPNTTGQAIAEGDDPINLKIYSLGLSQAIAEPYGGRYPCGTLVYNGVWYYGTYCLSPEGFTYFGGELYNWPWLGPVVGFRTSTDFGTTWKDCPHTPEKPLFNETGMYGYPVKIGAPHFVDFGKNMEHSPDGYAYLVGHGAEYPDKEPRFANLSWISGDQIYLIRVKPSIENINDASKYEFFGGHDKSGDPVWTSEFDSIKPLIDWNNNCGCVTITYNAPLKKYLMCVTDGWPTAGKMSSYILESDNVTGPWKLAVYMKDFGQQGYFLNFPSKFVSENGRKAWLCYSGNYWDIYKGEELKADPPGSHYGLVLQEIELLSKEMYNKHIDDLR